MTKYRLRKSRRTILRLITNQSYSEGDKVDTPDGLGVVTGVWTEGWDDDGEQIEASSDSPAYTVALLDGGFGHFSESDVSDAGDDWPETDVDDPAEDMAENGQAENIATNNWNAPPSWEDSETPVRVIALDTWSSMGGQFDCGGGACCKGTMRQAGMSERASDEFCASFKDYILGTEAWRGWGPD